MTPNRYAMHRACEALQTNHELTYYGWRTGDCMTVAVVLRRFFGNKGYIKAIRGGSFENDDWYIHFVYQYGLTVLDGMYVGRQRGLIEDINANLHWSQLEVVHDEFVEDDECVDGFEGVAFTGCEDHWPERWTEDSFDCPPEHGSVRDVACRLLAYLQSVVE